MSEPTTRVLDLSDYWNMVRARRWLVVIAAVAVAFAAATYVLLKPDVYLAQAKMVVQPLISPAIGQLAGSSANALTPDMATEAEVVRSITIAEDVKTALRLTKSPQAILKNLSVSVVRETFVMAVGYTDSDPRVAASVAEQFAVSYLVKRNAAVQDAVANAKTPLEANRAQKISERTDALKKFEAAKDPAIKAEYKLEVEGLTRSIEQLDEAIITLDSTGSASQGGNIVQDATIPSAPVGPKLPLALALGLVVGALLGSGLAIVSGLRENKVGGRDELAHHMGAPVMAVIPKVDGWDHAENAELVTREEPGAPASEAYRTLATNVRFLRSQQPLRILVVTSAMPGEGKSATAANLAVVLAETGLRTVLVDADLRRPRASRFIGVNDRAGLREALDGTRDLVDVIQATDTENLWIVGAGVIPQDPVSLLAGPNADSVFDGLRRVADIVVCDAPPTLPVADASVLAEKSDAVLFVHDPSISNRTALEDAVRQLRTAGGTIIGGVYNNISAAQRNYLGYSSYDEYYGPDRTSFRSAPPATDAPAEPRADGTKTGNGWQPQGSGDRASQIPGGRS